VQDHAAVRLYAPTCPIEVGCQSQSRRFDSAQRPVWITKPRSRRLDFTTLRLYDRGRLPGSDLVRFSSVDTGKTLQSLYRVNVSNAAILEVAGWNFCE